MIKKIFIYISVMSASISAMDKSKTRVIEDTFPGGKWFRAIVVDIDKKDLFDKFVIADKERMMNTKFVSYQKFSELCKGKECSVDEKQLVSMLFGKNNYKIEMSVDEIKAALPDYISFDDFDRGVAAGNNLPFGFSISYDLYHQHGNLE